MIAIIINVTAILLGLFGALFSESKGRIMFYVVLVLLNSGMLGYNICRLINGLE